MFIEIKPQDKEGSTGPSKFKGFLTFLHAQNVTQNILEIFSQISKFRKIPKIMSTCKMLAPNCAKIGMETVKPVRMARIGII